MSQSRRMYADLSSRPSVQFVVRLALAIFAVMAIAIAARAQTSYTFTTFAGPPGGPGVEDGTGSGARFNQPTGLATDGAGNMYLADAGNHAIRKVTPAGVVTTLAGRAGFMGSSDGTGGAARFNQPLAVAADSSGNVYVVDYGNSTIRKITPDGVVTTIAGLAGTSGSADGAGSAARFYLPRGLAVDAADNILVADQGNHTIRKITPAGVVTTLAGLAGSSGSANGTGSTARFSSPSAIAVDLSNIIYVADQFNRTIRKMTAAGVVTTLAGQVGVPGNLDGTGAAARFNNPVGIATDTAGNIFVGDQTSQTIRAVTPAGVVTTLAGLADTMGSVDGTGSAARFRAPMGVTTDSSANIYVADRNNHTIRKVTSAGVVTTFAGSPGGEGTTDGSGAAARFYFPASIAIDPVTGDVYVGEIFTIRKISAGVVTTLAGMPGTFGSADGTGSAAGFRTPLGIAIDASQNIYAADTGNHTIRKITMAGVVSTFAGLAGTPGYTDGIGDAARFRSPFGIAVDSFGNLYVAERTNQTIRMITPAGAVSTLAGSAGISGNVDGTGSAARFSSPTGIAIDSAGVLYVSDEFGQRIRKVTTPGGVVTTLAGAAQQPGSADGTGSAARFSAPSGLGTDSSGNVYVADRDNGTIRKITQFGEVTTIGGSPGVYNDADGTGPFAQFRRPTGIAVDSAGNIYVVDANNNKIKVGRPALHDTATIDSPTGNVFEQRRLEAVPQNGSTWAWTLTRQPGGSGAAIFDPAVPTTFFTPDVAGVYTFRLTASDGFATSITTVTLTVGPLPTSTQLASTPNPSLYNQTVTLTATVLSGGTPAQYVTFYDGPAPLATVALDGAGRAQLLLSTLSTGVHTLSASYVGDGQFEPSDSNAVTQTINRANPNIGFNSSLNPSTYGNAVTFTALVLPSDATGTVTFSDGGTTLATNPLSGTPPRIATLTTSSLSPGSHPITITYSGDSNYTPAAGSGVLTQSVYALFGPPPGLVASATSVTSVTVNWVTVAGADHYELVQTSGAAALVVTMPAVNTATVSGLAAGTTYLYKVQAVSSTGTMSGYSVIDPATTILFTDDPIVAGVTTARAVHIVELRQGVNAMRASVNLAAATFTDAVAAGSSIKAVHLNELRAALTAARTAMALSTVYTDEPIVASATSVKAAHIREVRDAIK